jgi:hypothetical protein
MKRNKKKEQKYYTLVMTEKQANIIKDALDVFSRLQMGQGWVIDDIFHQGYEKSRMIDHMFKSVYFPSLEENAYHGIHSKEISNDARVAYDMIQVIRHRIFWDNHPDEDKHSWCVSSHKPMKSSMDNKEDMIKIERVDNKNNKRYIPQPIYKEISDIQPYRKDPIHNLMSVQTLSEPSEVLFAYKKKRNKK